MREWTCWWWRIKRNLIKSEQVRRLSTPSLPHSRCFPRPRLHFLVRLLQWSRLLQMGANHSSDSGHEDGGPQRRTKRISSVPVRKTRGSDSSNDSCIQEKSTSAYDDRRRGSSSPRERGSSEEVSSNEALPPQGAVSLSLSTTSLNRNPSEKHVLTKRQRLLIQSSWKRSRKTGADNVGSRIFLLVLTAQPDIKMIFGLQKIPQGRLKYDPRFRQHAVVFTKTFDYIIKNLEYREKLEQHFQSLGKKHVTMQGRGFRPQYWDTFAECMTQTAIEWEGGRRCRETMNSWRILVGFIIKQMRTGFDLENSTRKRFSSVQPPSRKSASEPLRQKPPNGQTPSSTSVRSTEVRPPPTPTNGWAGHNGHYLHPHHTEHLAMYRTGSEAFSRQDSSRATSGYASDYGSDMSDMRHSPKRRYGRSIDITNTHMETFSSRQLPARPDQFYNRRGSEVYGKFIGGCLCPAAPQTDHGESVLKERSPSPPYLDALETLHIDSPKLVKKKISLPTPPSNKQIFMQVPHMVVPIRKYSTGVTYYQ
uniref:GLOBIN domain-containing protein n=1 Tax=Steinernema glaseri TaxID=37863 RepID=A0A1I7ZLA4_9BILA